MKICRRCDIKPTLTESEIQKMVDEVTSMRGVRLAGYEIYDERLSACTSCDKFLYGSTCSVCGCVMQVRARLADGKCPKKKWKY